MEAYTQTPAPPSQGRSEDVLMPMYLWECKGCGDQQEVRRKLSDYERGPGVCKSCGGKDLQRVIEKKTFILLGDSGWHHTDYSKTRSIK